MIANSSNLKLGNQIQLFLFSDHLTKTDVAALAHIIGICFLLGKKKWVPFS
jgi:hypothetical protein